MAEQADRPATGATKAKQGRGSVRTWIFAVLAGVLAIFVIQNSQEVKVEFFFATTDTPLFFALIIAAGAGALLGWLGPRLRPGRKR